MAFKPDPKPEPKPNKKYTFPQRKAPIAKQTTKNKAERAERRADLPGFYEALIAAASQKETRCENCNEIIKKPEVSNFAHILKKRLYVEVQTNPKNILRLCGRFDSNFCHDDFDSSLSKRGTMPVFEKAAMQIDEIRHLVTTNGSEIEQIDEYLKNHQ